MAAPRVTVHTNAILHNLRAFQTKVGPNCEVAGVIKGDGYGHGMVNVASPLVEAGCRTLMVATLKDAVKLREVVPQRSVDVVTLNGVNTFDARGHLDHAVIPGVCGLEELAVLRDIVETSDLSAVGIPGHDTTFPIYLQVDSGMHRAGLEKRERDAILKNPSGILGNRLRISCVMSHISNGDSDDLTHTEFQRTNFEQFTAEFERALRDAGLPAFRRSLCNSCTIFRDPLSHFDQVRPGNGLFSGKRNPFDPPQPHAHLLKPTISVRVPVVQVRHCEKGDTVGDGATWEVTADSGADLAVVYVGHAERLGGADGKQRATLFWNSDLAQRRVKIGGEAAVNVRDGASEHPHVFSLPVRGRVSKDTVVVDISAVPMDERPRRGDFVEVLTVLQPSDLVDEVPLTATIEFNTAILRRYRDREFEPVDEL